MEGVQPLNENVGNTPRSRCQRNKLLLVASVTQGLVLLLSLTFICLYRSAPQVQYPPIQSIRVQFTVLPFSGCEKNFFRITSPDKAETMKVQNDSVIINCDGFYLISLKGYFSQEVNISLHYRKGQNPVSIQSFNNKVNFITVAWLAFKDKVFLNVSTPNTSCLPVNGGELVLIHQNPGGFCAH